MGRPTEFTEETAKQAERLCSLGATDTEIAEFFEVSTRTIYRWKNMFPEFCHALKVGKDLADDRVERSLYHRAVGYDYTEQQAIKVKAGKDAEGGLLEDVQVVDLQKHVPADTTAQIFWLKNRRKDEWRDKQEHELTGKDGGAIKTEEVGAGATKLTQFLDGIAKRSAADSSAAE